MNRQGNNIVSILRLISFVCVLYALAIQPVISSFIQVNEISNEIVSLDTEENSNKNQENEEKEESKKLDFFTSHIDSIEFVNKIFILYKSNLLCDITLDMHIPPPEIIQLITV